MRIINSILEFLGIKAATKTSDSRPTTAELHKRYVQLLAQQDAILDKWSPKEVAEYFRTHPRFLPPRIVNGPALVTPFGIMPSVSYEFPVSFPDLSHIDNRTMDKKSPLQVAPRNLLLNK